MMKRYPFIQIIALLLALAMLFPMAVAAGDQADAVCEPAAYADAAPGETALLLGGTPEPTAMPEGLVRNPKGVPDDLTLGVKDAYAIDVKRLSKKKKVEFTSENPKIAAVDDAGIITAKKTGVSTVFCKRGKKTLATIVVTVVPAPKKVRLNAKKLTVGVKEGVRLAATLTKDSASTLTWTSSDERVATVSGDGKVKGKKPGKATITVQTHNRKKARATVTVKDAPKKVTLDEKALALSVGDSHALTATLPKDAASYALTWTSSDASVATVDAKGVVTAVGPGAAKITVRTYNRKKATCTVTVSVPETPAPEPTLTPEPSGEPTGEPTATPEPTGEPTAEPTVTPEPSGEPTGEPTATPEPSGEPTVSPEATTPAPETTTPAPETTTPAPEETTPAPEVSSLDDFIIEDGVITKYVGAGGDVVIPSKDKDGNAVVGIGERAFEKDIRLYSVTIPDSITSIGHCAFYECIGPSAIYSPSIEAWLSIDLASSFTSYGHDLYIDNKIATEITIPDGVISIGSYAFELCRSLTSVTIPDGVTSIGEAAFNVCDNLTSVTISGNVKDIGDRAFQQCERLDSLTIHDGVTTIGAQAFFWCNSLTSVTIPGSVTSIGMYAFSGCMNLTSVTMSNGITDIDIGAFEKCGNLTSVTVPGSVVSIGAWAFFECSNMTDLVILNGVISINDCAFANCSKLTNVTIPESVTIIHGDAFNGCSSMTRVTIPGSVYEIRDYAFSGCSSLTIVNILNGTTIIDTHVFHDCESLTSVIIPSSVASIGEDVFYNCHKLIAYVEPGSYAEQYCVDNNVPFLYISSGTLSGKFTLHADREFYKLGSNITLTASASGGVAPYQYNYVMVVNNSASVVSGWVDSASYGFTASEVGTAQIAAVVRDANGDMAQSKILKVTINETGYDTPDDVAEYNGHYYYAFGIDAQTDTWKKAQSYCALRGGYLATVTSDGENAFVYNDLFLPSAYTHAYFGLSDARVEDVWRWGNGEASDYQNWEAGWPVRADESCDYAMFSRYYADGGWLDGSYSGVNAGDGIAFICEWGDYTEGSGKITLYGDHRFDYYLDEQIIGADSSDYSPRLAHMLMALSAAAYSEGEIKSAYGALGFRDGNVRTYSYYSDPNDAAYGEDNVACAIGEKPMANGETLVLVVVRGSYGDDMLGDSDWKSNWRMNTGLLDGTHYGFNTAAEKVYGRLTGYLGNDLLNDKIRYVVTGHSRGAAVANLLAVRLAAAGVPQARLFDYNFACPDVAKQSLITNWASGHENMFNICNTADLVSVVPGVPAGGLASILNASLRNLFTAWGKYGNTWFFCRDWNKNAEFDLCQTFESDSSHAPGKYANDMRNMADLSPGDCFRSWGDVVGRQVDSTTWSVVEQFIEKAFASDISAAS